MKRRDFALLASTSALALMDPTRRSFADAPDPSLLTTTLTPFGAERAGNAAGTIPAWTGGLTAIPASFDWDPDKTLPPDFFASDTMLYKIDSSNMEQYAVLLSDGLRSLIKRNGFYINVYPSRRTQACPQWVYDNIAKNVTRVTPQSGDYRMGFNGGYGGYPFPILSSNPSHAGAQAIWNSEVHWFGSYMQNTASAYTNANGVAVLATGERNQYKCDFYLPGGSPETFSGYIYYSSGTQFAPATVAGGQFTSRFSSNPALHPQMIWQVLAGQGRVRRAPNLAFDTPSSYADGIANYDEYFGFTGALYKYDWRLVGKQEMLIPYNNNKVFTGRGAALHKAGFFDPEYVRWELHRCWVVEATLHPGQRNVLATRKFYLDEDIWQIAVTDSWDSAGNLAHTQYTLNANFPNLPGTIFQNSVVYNLQTQQYVTTGGSFGDPPYNTPFSFAPIPGSVFDPGAMAAAAAY